MKVEKSFIIDNEPVNLVGTVKDLLFYQSNRHEICYIVRGEEVIGELYTSMHQGSGFVAEAKEVSL